MHKMSILPAMSERRQSYEQGPSAGDTQRRKASGDLGFKVPKELEDVFHRLVTNAVTLAGARAGSLSLLSPGSKTPVPLVVYSPDGYQPSRREYASIARWVVTHRAPTIVDQAGLDPRMQEPGAAAAGSAVCVPLLAGQEVQGTLMISSLRPWAFNRQHQKLLEALADVAAAAILQARQQEAAAQQAQHLTTLVEVARALSNTKEMRQVLSLTTAGIRRLITCEEAVLFSYEDETRELRGVAGLGTQSMRLAEQRIQLDDMQSVTAWVARQRRPLLHSSGSRAFVGPVTDTLLTRQDLALLAVPLVSQDELWGVLTLARAAPFDKNDLRTMLSLGSFVAPALGQATYAEAEP